MNEEIFRLKVITTKNIYHISEESEIDQEGSLIRFYKDGEIQLVVNSEDFLWREKIQLVNIEGTRGLG